MSPAAPQGERSSYRGDVSPPGWEKNLEGMDGWNGALGGALAEGFSGAMGPEA